MKKQLITAEVIHTMKQAGMLALDYDVSQHIITPEAREVAKDIGVDITQKQPEFCSHNPVQSINLTIRTEKEWLDQKDIKVISDALLVNMPREVKTNQDLVERIVRNIICSLQNGASSHS